MSDPKCEDLIDAELSSRLEDIKILLDLYQEDPEAWCDEGRLDEYGLCFDYEREEGYFCWLIGTGGPHSEFRFYMATTGKPYSVVFHFNNWFDYSQRTVTEEGKALLDEVFDILTYGMVSELMERAAEAE